MGYKENRPTPQAPFPYLAVAGKKGIAVGTTYYVMAFGKCEPDDIFWKNSNPDSDSAPLRQATCQFWMDEKGEADETNRFVKWHYTGKNDPVHVLGLDTRNQDLERLKEIYGEKAPRYPVQMPEETFILPVFQIEKKSNIKGAAAFDTSTMVAKLLIVRKNMMADIIQAGSSLEHQTNSDLYGRILQIDKNLTDPDPKKIYQFKVNVFDPFDLSEYEDEITAMRTKADNDLERLYLEANGNSYDPENAWNYLLTHFKGSKDQLIAKYSVKLGAGMVFGGIEEVDL